LCRTSKTFRCNMMPIFIIICNRKRNERSETLFFWNPLGTIVANLIFLCEALSLCPCQKLNPLMIKRKRIMWL
jgi:hypothetical protein